MHERSRTHGSLYDWLVMFKNPMFQDMYDGQNTAGMVAREQHAN